MDSHRNQGRGGVSDDNYGNNSQSSSPHFDNRSSDSEFRPVGQHDGIQNRQSTQNPIHVEMANFTPSLEDRMLLKSLARESFWYRSFPFALISSTAYYYYNEKHQRPHRFARYSGIALVAYIAGKLSYLREGQRRLLDSPSNSPFVTGLRKKVRPEGEVYRNDYNDTNDKYNETSSMGWAEPGSSEFMQDAVTFESNQPSSIHKTPTSPTLTYDELRARNREIYLKETKRN